MQTQGFQACRARVYRAINDTYRKVYGRESGDDGEVFQVAEIDCVVSGDDFFPSDSHSAGTLQEGWMYTVSDVPKVGDRIEIVREGKQSRRYEIVTAHRNGTTQVVFQKLKLSAIGD